MSELIAKLQELRRIPAGQHWFCPSYEYLDDYEGEDEPPASVIKNEDSTETDLAYRRKLVTDSLQIYAYDGEDVFPHQEYLKQQIDRHLGKCDLCIVQYYKARHGAMESLRGEYDDDDVTALEKVFDEYDLDRIKRGLEDAVQVLRAAAPQQRGKDILKISSQLALFEALSSQAFLADPSLVEKYLDEPFQLVQTNKRLRLARYVPAATVFLFDISPQKCLWAMQAWSKLPSPITKADFDFAVRDPLLKNLKTASEPITDLSFNQRLWYGIRQIIEKLDNELVTHSLRAMEVDLFRIMLEHLQYRTPALRFLLQTMQRLLEIAPKDYWDSMGAISPTTVIEQVFNNPQYDQFIQEARPDEEFGTSALKDLLSWIKPFLASLQIGHQAQACRSLTFQLMDRLQADRFPAYARTKCYQTGLEVLIWALESCNKEDMISKPVGRIIAGECLKVMDTYIGRILEMSSLSKNEDPASLVEPRLAIVKAALALECKSLKMDQQTIMQKKCVPATPGPFSTTLWDAVVNNMKNRNILLAGAVLAGITDLAGLESFRTDQSDASTKVKKAFNKEWDRVTHRSCEALQRINDFNPDDLDELFQQSDTSAAIFAALFSPDPSTHNAAVNLIKSVSSESGRREAIRHLLLPFFATTLTSLSRSIRWITRNRSFARCPIMLKTCGDTLDVLGDYGSGLLRTRPLSSFLEVDALEKFWEEQWQALKAIYETTEEWGKMKVQDSRGMRDFCRDTMDFSDRLFDQYSLYASAINAAVSDKMVKEGKPLDRKAGKELLRLPARGMEAMVQWLKLRDVQLAGTAVKLTKKVLDRLTEWGMKVDDAPRELLERIIQNGPQGRTHLTPQEKAELARALEANLGHSISPVDTDQERPIRDSSQSSTKAKKTKLGTIDLTDWRSKAKLPVNVVDVSDDGDFGDSDILDQDILSASRSVELLKEQKSSRASSHDGIHGASLRAKISRLDNRAINSAKHDIQVRADQISFRAKREKERAAKKKRDAEELAIVKKRIANKSGPGSVIEEGSVLGQIGIKGKDHAPKVASMMVSSESESDSDDQLDSELFGGGSKTAKVSDAVRDYQSSRMKQAREPQPVKKTKQVRSAKDMRARLAPDLVSLHNTILGWDFFHSGDFPPGSERQDYSLVTNVFRHPKEYQSTFEPLLILEAWQGFLKSREEGNFKPFPISVSNRCTVDSFIEVSTVMQAADAKNSPISEADVVLMSKAPSPTTDDKQPHCFARVFKVVRKKTFIEIAYRINVGNSLVSSIVPNATLFGAKIQSLTPLEREYGALLGLQYFDLCDEIIKAKPSPLLSYSEKQIAPLVANFRINVAQAKAVKSAMDNDGFTLIQGPPGSGKTKTIVALVGALMTSQFGERGIAIARPRSIDPRQIPTSATKKLLVCAPSNAAVDELVMRFKEGVKLANGQFQDLAVVRLGRSDAINANVLDVTLEELVNAKLNSASKKRAASGEDIHSIMTTHKATCEELNTLRATIDSARASGKSATQAQEREFDLLKRKKQQLSDKIDAVRDSGETVARNLEIARRKVQQDILDGAHIICATLSGSGHEMFQNLDIEFETVIIDEAAQSIELSALIPLKYGCSKCILVGDPKQLPPTVLSREAARFQYEQSLFVRMQVNHQSDVHLLDTQYRMHPEISSFPSQTFYDGRLLDGEDMAVVRTKPWHQCEILGPYRFFDVQGTHHSAPRGHSLINIAEIEVALKLYERLTTDCQGYDFTGKVGIITPYKSQLRELRSRFAGQYGESILSRVEFNTTDAFQGRESEVIIFSCVRASVTGGIGFLSDIRRMNVGITRAKSSLWVLGNSHSLMKGEFWGRLIQDAKHRDRYTEGNLLAMLEKPLLNLGMESSALAGASSVNSGSKPNQDMQLQGVPTPGIIKNESRRSSSAKQSPVDKPMEDARAANPIKINDNGDQKTQPSTPGRYAPSGGFNGLNSNLNCGICGSSAHWANNCDNEEAKGISSAQCYRCNDPDHRSLQCTAKRCLDCGAFGHIKETCASTQVLSKEAKHNIWKQESAHRHLLSRAPEIQRRRQLGDHAKEVPKVRITSESPPPKTSGTQALQNQQTASGKRKRQPSPSRDVPNKRKVSSSESKDLNQVNGSGPTGLVIPKPPDQNDNSLASGISKHHHEQNMNMGLSASNPALSQAKGPLPVQSQPRPPIRRKKEVSLFIKPKPRR